MPSNITRPRLSSTSSRRRRDSARRRSTRSRSRTSPATSGSTPGATCASADVLDLRRADPARRRRRAVPGLFTQVPPNNDCQLANSNGGPTEGHPLGFTKQGCDIYSRIIHGTSTSLSVGLIVTVIVAVHRHPLRRVRRLLRRLARLGALPRRRHLLRDPLHPRRHGHHVGALAVPRTCGSSRSRSASSPGRQRRAS